MKTQIKELLEKYKRYRDESHDLLDKFADMDDKKNKILGFIGVYTTIIEDLQDILDSEEDRLKSYNLPSKDAVDRLHESITNSKPLKINKVCG